MIAEIAVAVTIGIVLARVLTRVGGVLIARFWDALAFGIASAWPKEQRIPAWFSTVHEMVTSERLEQ